MSTDPPHDFVDELIASWAASRPDFDVSPVAVVTRLSRIRDHFEGEMAAVFGSYGLTATTFVMLATLARLGPVDDARLGEELGLTGGTISGRVDRLVADGLVERAADGAVTFTESGQVLVDEVIPAHLANQARLLSVLDSDEQAALAGLLRKLLVGLEGPR